MEDDGGGGGLEVEGGGGSLEVEGRGGGEGTCKEGDHSLHTSSPPT